MDYFFINFDNRDVNIKIKAYVYVHLLNGFNQRYIKEYYDISDCLNHCYHLQFPVTFDVDLIDKLKHLLHDIK